VGWLSRWLKPSLPDVNGTRQGDAAKTPATSARSGGKPSPSPLEGLERLFHVGEPRGASVEEGLSMLEAARSSPDEATALEGLVRRSKTRALPEPIAVAAASALVDRGEPLLAERLVDGAVSPSARLLLADLRAERGDVAGALATVERVLLRCQELRIMGKRLQDIGKKHDT